MLIKLELQYLLFLRVTWVRIVLMVFDIAYGKEGFNRLIYLVTCIFLCFIKMIIDIRFYDSAEDAGTYRCIAENSAGKEDLTLELTVNGKFFVY